MTEVSLFLQSAIATSLANVDSKRFRKPSMDKKRTESWTEIWGKSDEEVEDDTMEDKVIATQLQTLYPKLPLTLFQFRPAWAEQLVLSLAKIPFVVVNARYAATEATGSLPYLRDLPDKSRSTTKPALVGRYHPGRDGPSETNAILDYLQSTHCMPFLDESLSTTQQGQRHLLQNLILHELQPILHALRYEDTETWEQLYRSQYRTASRGHPDQGYFSIGSWWQTWAVRAVARKSLLSKGWTYNKAKQMARPCYTTLESILEREQYLLGTVAPTIVDCLLFDHIAEALCNVHLIQIIADFPKLIQFFQDLYETHFRVENNLTEEWKLWNRQENLMNSFQTLPIEKKWRCGTEQPFKDALELMQYLSVHQHNLQEVLNVLKEKRAHEAMIKPKKELSTLWFWRMGDCLKIQNDKPKQVTVPLFPRAKWHQKYNCSNEILITAGVAFSLTMIGTLLIKGR